MIGLNFQRRPLWVISVPCVTLNTSTNESVLGKTFLMDSKLCFIYCFAFRSCHYWARDLLRSRFGKLLCVCNAGNHRVLIVVVLLICLQIIFVQPLFYSSHVTVALHRLPTLDLLIKLLLIHDSGPISGLLFPLFELSVENSCLLRLNRFVLLSRLLQDLLLSSVGVQLVDEWILMFGLHSSLVILDSCGALVHQALIGLNIVCIVHIV